MTYRYDPPTATPSRSRSDIEAEFSRWNAQAGETVLSDYDLPMMRPGQVEAEVRFLLRGQPMRVRIDRWGDFATNLKCVHLNIRDMRLAEARGSLEAMRETLTALPAPKQDRDPYEVLGIRPDASPAVIDAAYRAKAHETHPDHGGKEEAFKEVQAAYDRVKSA